ncbi:MAG: ABC transporter ATP-binding protein [Sphingopyxis sp.]|nr:ABC transporter ATP-binding protein [Sphingopyxis sp.]
MTLLRFDNVGVAYRGQTALHGLCLDVGAGEIVGLIGESGSGKSTAALAAIDLLPAGAVRTGTILIEGRDLASLTEDERDAARGGAIGMIFQEPMRALNPLQTIGAQVAETVRLHHKVGRRAARDEADALLERVGLPASKVAPSRFPHQLSGGQRQRVCIAIAIAGNPRILIADEPTTALDVTTQARVIALLVELARERGMGLLLVSHDLALVGEVADRIVVLKNGQQVEAGPTRQILGSPQQAYTRTLIESARHKPERTAPAADSPPLLDVRSLDRNHRTRRTWRRQPPVKAIDDISFTVAAGETLGIVGESGAGKTSLLRTILGLDRPDGGSVTLDDADIFKLSRQDLRDHRRKIQAVFQDPAASLDPRQRVETIVAEPLYLLVEPISAAERRARVEAILERVGLTPADADKLPHQFSGGQRQRIAIARALILKPKLVVLDEAVSALDVSIRADILDLLACLGREFGIAYLFVSHDLSVMRAVTDRLLVLQNGKIVEQGPTAELLASPRHPHTRELVEASPDLDRVIAQLV